MMLAAGAGLNSVVAPRLVVADIYVDSLLRLALNWAPSNNSLDRNREKQG